MITLYVKQHNKTGLKYFGKTTSKKVCSYLGSGSYWRKHLRKHGKDISTIEIWTFESIEEASCFALEFSKINDIVASEEWANLQPENAVDGCPVGQQKSENHRLHIGISMSGENNPMFGKHHSEITKNKQSVAKLGKPNTKLRGKEKSEEHKKNLSIAMEGKNPKMNHTNYSFIHESGIIETCTQVDLVKKYNLNAGAIYGLVHRIKNRKSHKGWKLL